MAIAACTVLFALPAAAVDGEILVDQAKVNAGGITPGDDPGFPATLSKPGRYKLSGNLAVAGGPALVVTANDVSIDLNGFTIRSNPPGAATYGVDAGLAYGLRVANGTITGFFNYAVYHGGKRGVVENMRLVSNGNGGVFVSTEGRIRNNTIANNYIGIACNSCLIEQNMVTGNKSAAIVVRQATVLGNVIVGNGGGLVSGTGSPGDGYGNNILVGNAGGAQVTGPAFQLHPNVCDPACP